MAESDFLWIFLFLQNIMFEDLRDPALKTLHFFVFNFDLMYNYNYLEHWLKFQNIFFEDADLTQDLPAESHAADAAEFVRLM